MKTQYKYLIWGIGFGLLFPIGAIIADCFIFHEIPFGIRVWNRMVENPIHFIILSAPLILGITFYVIGRGVQKQELLNQRMKASNELLDKFNYHVSHDLKTVMNHQKMLSVMADKYVKKENKEKLEEIINKLMISSESGLNTIHGFLRMSKEGFGTQEELRGGCVVRKVVQDVLQNYDLLSAIEVTYDQEEYELIQLGEHSFSSIIQNLVTNSIKYNKRKPEAVISLKDEKGAQVLIYRDNGIGIDMEKDGDRIFKPFTRIESSVASEGTGIGMFLVQKIILASGGDITVSSTLGQGTEFNIRIPKTDR